MGLTGGSLWENIRPQSYGYSAGQEGYGPLAQNKPPGFSQAPDAPQYVSGWNNSERIAPGVQGQLNGLNINTQGIDKYRQEALRNGPSAWSAIANQQQQQLTNQQRDTGMADVNSGSANARSALSAKGGLSGGASERIARQGAANQLAVGQNAAQTQSNNALDIAKTDEQNREAQLGALPGAENTALQPQFQKIQMGTDANKFDIGQQAAEAGNQNQFYGNQYENQMKGWASQNQAKQEGWAAQHTGGLFGKGGFLGLGF